MRGRRKAPYGPPDEESIGAKAAADSDHCAAGGLSRSRLGLAALAVMATVCLGGAAFQSLSGASTAAIDASAAAPAAFVGTETCAGCHQAQTELWRNSQHRLAMQHATEGSVLGDFNDARFAYYGVESRFFREDGKFLVETDGPDGKLATFEVKYTFGVDPLQQYLIEFPDGRLQALSIAWDSRPKNKGGQRWFHLYPNEEIRHHDVLHWTKLNQNWNFMCAECHSTGIRKNYDPARDRFATTWTEISVGCEACHGQGSRHVAWARNGKSEDPDKGLPVRFDERRNRVWPIDPGTGNATPAFTPPGLRKEVETCGLCHARRSTISEDWIPGRWLSDTHRAAPLTRGLYEADGQMRDEVYNYGPFKQSKMFAAGVTCSDCHEPHGAALRVSGDGVCLQCHSSNKYAAASHHHHDGVAPPLACSSCHMPARAYMVIDRRHDHSFRVPRPDVSARLGTPNACNDCHVDRSADWAAQALERWHGPNRKSFQNYADAFHAVWGDQTDAGALLSALASDGAAPSFVRAGALSELAGRASPSNIDLAKSSLADPDPMVRIGALDMLEGAPPAQIWPLASPLLSDPSLGVRVRAVALLAPVPSANRPQADRERFERAAAEFVATQKLNADRPEARAALGGFYAQRGAVAEAEAEYKAALQLSPQHAPSAINLADLYRVLGRDADGEGVLRMAIGASPRDAGLHHALGLALIRLKRRDQALIEFRRATELAPDQARYAYVYAVGLHSSERGSEALAVLKENLVRHPGDRNTLQALISFSRDAGELESAADYAERLARIMPGDARLNGLIENLRRQIQIRKAQ